MSDCVPSGLARTSTSSTAEPRFGTTSTAMRWTLRFGMRASAPCATETSALFSMEMEPVSLAERRAATCVNVCTMRTMPPTAPARARSATRLARPSSTGTSRSVDARTAPPGCHRMRANRTAVADVHATTAMNAPRLNVLMPCSFAPSLAAGADVPAATHGTPKAPDPRAHGPHRRFAPSYAKGPPLSRRASHALRNRSRRLTRRPRGPRRSRPSSPWCGRRSGRRPAPRDGPRGA